MLKTVAIFIVSLSVFAQAQASTLKNSSQAKAAPNLIEKALIQKQENPELDQRNIKLITTMKNTPSQNLLAAQQQSFSRFVQSLFGSKS